MKSKRNPRTCPYYEIAVKRTCIIVASISDHLEKKDIGDKIVRALCDAYEAGQYTSTSETDETLLDVIRRLEDPALGMAYVPDVVREIGKDDMMAGYREGLVELRPESGMGRLSPVDAALCPAAIDGTPLSWVRIL